MYKVLLGYVLGIMVVFMVMDEAEATALKASPLELELEVCNDLYKLSRGVLLMKEDGATHEQYNESILTSNFTSDEMFTMLKLGEIIYDGFLPSQIFQSCAMNAYRDHGRQL